VYAFRFVTLALTQKRARINHMAWDKKQAAKWGRVGGKAGGKVGGKSTSAAKRRAAKKNGEQGGRPRTRTLAEHLLNRKLTSEQHTAAMQGFYALQVGNDVTDQVSFRNYFNLGEHGKLNDFDIHGLATKKWRRGNYQSRRLKLALVKFRAMARFFLKQKS
jgi:hypothetical protein